MGLGWVQPGGAIPDASEIPSDGPSTVQADLDAHGDALSVLEGMIVIDSVAKLEQVFPNVAGVHTIDKQTVWVSQTGAPFDLTATGRSTEVVDPGTMVGLGGLKVQIVGDVAGPLNFGEPVISNMAFLNVNPGGSDVAWESLSGRLISVVNVALLGANAGTISNVTGVGLFAPLQLIPPAPGASGIVIDGVCAATRLDVAAVAPGTTPYTAVTLAPTCVIAVEQRFDGCVMFGSPAVDSLLDVHVSATLPTAPVPTTVGGFEVFGCSLKGGATLFKPGGLDQKDLRILSASNAGAPSSGFIGDARADTTGSGTPISQAFVAADTWEVVPTDNGAGISLVINTDLTQRHSVQTVDGAIVLQYDGTQNGRTAAVGWSGSVDRTGAGAVLDAQLEYSEDGGTVWIPLPDTLDSTPLASGAPAKVEGRTIVAATDVGFMIRLVSRITVQATVADWHTLELSKGI